ncbi:RNA polymerase sigma factor [Catalinimonas sp. 4WD22]|uniref:RNA polymerase sigma factor n=1 Tax=Catalinimonas locisalis TaxID=3133978 RepID=UPI0031016895
MPEVQEDRRLLSLINKCKKNDRKAQKILYKHFFPYAMSISLRYSQYEAEAEEILNDAFLKVFTRLDQYNIKQSFKGWLRRIVINTAIDLYRKELRHYHHMDVIELEEEQMQENVIDQLSAQEIQAMISELPPAYRLVFNLYAVEGYNHQEIASMLDISEGTSKSNLFKARAKLQKKMQRIDQSHYGRKGI